MAILVELENSPDFDGCGLDQLSHKERATVWPKNKADKVLTLLDSKKRKLHLELDYEHHAGKPTIVSVFVSHWIINETNLHLKYFDCSSGSPAKPANYENRPVCKPIPFMYSVKTGQTGKFGVGLSGGKIDHKAVSLNHAELCTTLHVKTPPKKANVEPREGPHSHAMNDEAPPRAREPDQRCPNGNATAGVVSYPWRDKLGRG